MVQKVITAAFCARALVVAINAACALAFASAAVAAAAGTGRALGGRRTSATVGFLGHTFRRSTNYNVHGSCKVIALRLCHIQKRVRVTHHTVYPDVCAQLAGVYGTRAFEC